MKIETYKVCNPNLRVEINLNETLQQYFARTDQIIKHLREIRPEIVPKYLLALKRRLTDVVKDFSIVTSSFDLKEMTKNLTVLKDHQDLQNQILQVTAKHLELPTGFQPGSETIEITSLSRVKSLEKLAYHRVKACAEVLGDEQGIQLWKEVTGRLIEDDRLEYERAVQEMTKQGKKFPSSAEMKERNIQYWTKIGLADFTVATLDADMTLYRFDRCLTHEALKDLDDPDFAYLCSCYIGDAEGYNFKSRFQYLRRTQTLHHGDFCDELYWNPLVYTDPEQPSLEFTRKLGRESL
jgi:hypothetical protein